MNPNGDEREKLKGDRDRAIVENARRQIEAAKLEAENTTRAPQSPMQSPDADAASGQLPDSFSGYDLVRQIHRGGQGVVYQAIQRTTKRKVAIKVLRDGPFAGPRDKARFEREVQILGQLSHPNIVGIHDSGVAAGNFFYVMDYISGQSLDVFMASRARSIEETLRLFAEICEAISAAHLRGVIHRDLKPGNIRIDQDGNPHILDFGLAKTVMGEATDGSHAQVMSMTGQFVGSAPWASPEQAEGIPGKIDVRTDVYSLGVILYQMLTARFPYEVVGNMREVLDNILSAVPIRPSTIRKQINNELETIVLRCLSKERARRYQSAGELARDIRHYLAGEPIEAKRDSTLYILRKSLGRHKNKIAIGATLTVLFTSVGAALLLQEASHRAEDQTRDAESLVQDAALRIADRRDLEIAESELLRGLKLRQHSPRASLWLGALYAIRGLDAPVDRKDRFAQLAVESFHRSHVESGGTPLIDDLASQQIHSSSGGQGSTMALKAAADLLMASGDHEEAKRFNSKRVELSRETGHVLFRTGVDTIPPIYDLRFDRLMAMRPHLDTPERARRKIDNSATISRVLRFPIGSLDPHKTAMPDEYIEELIYDPLFVVERNGLCVPNSAIVASHAVTDSGARWEIEIRPGLKWHDGEPFTIDDILFTWTTFRERLSKPIDSVSRFNDHRVVFARNGAKLAPVAMVFAILPRHVYDGLKHDRPELTDAELAQQYLSEIGKRPIGNGPFKVLEAASADRVALVRWEEYPGTKPYIRQVLFDVVADLRTRRDKLAGGVVDEMELTSEEWAWHINGESFEGKIDKLKYEKWQYDYIGWNCSSPASPFVDPRTRRAMTLALDIDAIRANMFNSLYAPCFGVYPPDSWMLEGISVGRLRHEPREAERLLDEAGWQLSSASDKVRQKNGKLLQFTLLVPIELASARIMGLYFREQWARVGIRANLEFMPFEEVMLKVKESDQTFDAYIGGLISSSDPGEDRKRWSSKGDKNYVGYSNARVDHLFEIASAETDSEKLRVCFQEIHRLIYDDQPFTFLWQKPALWAVSKRLRGVNEFSSVGPALFFPGPRAWWVAAESPD